jgi:hypothetical protein
VVANLGADVTAMLDNVESTVRALAARFGFTDVGGVRKADQFPDHPGGYAADFMTKSRGQGDQLTAFAVSQPAQLGVDYMIWYGKVWDIDKDPVGLPHSQWRTYTGTSNPHTDHVHITFKRGITPMLDGLAGGVQNVVGGLFDLDGFMKKAEGTTITLLAAAAGLALIGVGVVLAVRPALRSAVRSNTGV